MSPAKRKRDWLINLILAAALSFVASMIALTLMEHAGPKVLAGPRMLFVALPPNELIIQPFSLDKMTSEMERTGNQPANSKNQALNMNQAEQISHSATLVTSETQTENRPDKSKIERMQVATVQADIPKDQYASTAMVTAAETVRQARPSLACLEKGIAQCIHRCSFCSLLCVVTLVFNELLCVPVGPSRSLGRSADRLELPVCGFGFRGFIQHNFLRCVLSFCQRILDCFCIYGALYYYRCTLAMNRCPQYLFPVCLEFHPLFP